MEFHNYNTPLDRIDESFVKQILSGELEHEGISHNKRDDIEVNKSDCGCSSQTGTTKTCRYNRRYSRYNETFKKNRSNDCNSGCGCKNTRMEVTDKEDSCGDSVNKFECGCGECEGFSSPELSGVPYSMVYSPYQHFDALYECEEALDRGTIFRCLDFPFYPTPCKYDKCAHENKGCR